MTLAKCRVLNESLPLRPLRLMALINSLVNTLQKHQDSEYQLQQESSATAETGRTWQHS